MVLALLIPFFSGLLFSKLRFGWKMTIEAIPQTQKPSSKPSLQTFMVVGEKEMSSTLYEITALFNNDSLDCNGVQVCETGLHSFLDNNKTFSLAMYHICSTLFYTMKHNSSPTCLGLC